MKKLIKKIIRIICYMILVVFILGVIGGFFYLNYLAIVNWIYNGFGSNFFGSLLLVGEMGAISICILLGIGKLVEWAFNKDDK
jgi:hypothetical protein